MGEIQKGEDIVAEESIAIFLGYSEDPDRYAELFKKLSAQLSDAAITLVNFNLINPAVNLSNFKILNISEILNTADYRFMDGEAYRLTREWHAGRKYNGINLGALAEATAQQVLSMAVRNAFVVSRAMASLKPRKAFIIDEFGDLPGLERFIKTEYKIVVSRISGAQRRLSFKGCIAAIKARIAFIISSAMDRFAMLRLEKEFACGKNAFMDAGIYSLLDKYPIIKSKFIPFIISGGLKLRIDLMRSGNRAYLPVVVRDSTSLFANIRSIKMQILFNNTDIWPLAEKGIRNIITVIYPSLLANIRKLELLYNKHRVNMIVLREAVRESERSITFAASRAGIATLVVQSGALAIKNVYTKIHSDKAAVWGQASVEWYKSFGNDESKCIVTGNPKYDRFFEAQKEAFDKKDVLESLGLDPARKTVLHILDFIRFYPMLAPSFFVDLEKVIIRDLVEAVKKIPELQLILKFHPFEYPDIWLRSLKRYGGIDRVAVVKDFDLAKLMAVSDVVTTAFSTVGIEAQFFNKPLVSFGYYGSEEAIPYGERGVAIMADNSSQVIPAIKKALYDKGAIGGLASRRHDFVRDYAYKIDGGSASRVLSVIKRIGGYEDTSR